MAAKLLNVLLDGRVAGMVRFENNRLGFRYADEWREFDDAYPLSLSMPLAARDHPHARIEAFIWNLLPDNDRTLDSWARQFQVSARNPFALIGAVGEDCAGAVQFVAPERLDAALLRPSPRVQWLDEVEIGNRLRSVLSDAGTGRTAGDNGQFSLAGAQPKTALLKIGDRWGVPSGRTPTTHILKPPGRDLPGHAENEHFCLTLARELGLSAALSDVRVFDGQQAIVVERYDRIRTGRGPGGLMRVHQEDMCQALAIKPDAKYQAEGGPSPEMVIALMAANVDQPDRVRTDVVAQDRARFLDALIFNWLIGGTDAHAKNYALLIGGGGTVRLAPLYDIASAFAFPQFQIQRMKLAMKIEYYRLDRVLPRHFGRLAARTGINPDDAIGRIATLAHALPTAIDRVSRRMATEGLDHPVLDRLRTTLTVRSERVAAQLTG